MSHASGNPSFRRCQKDMMDYHSDFCLPHGHISAKLIILPVLHRKQLGN